MHHDDHYYQLARKRVKAKKGFYAHLITYCSVIGMLMVVNLLIDPWDWWFQFPAMGWGFGLVFHYLGVFVFDKSKYATTAWEERAIEKEMDRMRGYDPPEWQSAPSEAEIDEEPFNEELELRDFKKLRREWDDADFV